MSEAPREESTGSNPITDAEAAGQPPTFEQAIEQLESIIEGIESGEVGLESSLQQYERGMKLIRHCRGVLERAEQRIEKLTVDEAGELTASDEAGPDAGAGDDEPGGEHEAGSPD